MASSSRASTLTPCRSPTPPSIPVQPDHFYGSENVTFPPSPDSDGKTWLDPEDDPLAQRGIPVFKPTMEEFEDFEGYMNRVEVWGMKSGIVKIIPPKEWTESLPELKQQLVDVKIKTPIEQHMMGSGGLFRQENMEKRKLMSVREWVELCSKDEFRAPGIQEVGLSSRKDNVPVRTRPPRRTKQKADATPASAGPSTVAVKDEPDDEDVVVPESVATPPHSDGTPPPPTTKAPATKATKGKKKKVVKVEPKPRPKRVGQTREAREASLAQRAARDRAFIDVFDPDDEWLPANTKSSDYNEEFCQKLERHYWRNCGLGKPAWYGADTQGSLFTDDTTAWNVAHLPSALSRLLPESEAGLPGVNTPYLYFGMWRATFAWHVEDMDLFSINYIHFGAPKFWYAVPQGKAAALESTMRGYFPKDTSQCHQFLRHKSFLASPTLLANSSCRPNHLVQKSGEFVITFPRGYHAGFNLGLNCAESVNFALESWLEIGRRAKACECISDSVRIDVDQLLQDREEERQEALQAAEEELVATPSKPSKRSSPKKPAVKDQFEDENLPSAKKPIRKRKSDVALDIQDQPELPKLKKIKIKHSPSKPSASTMTTISLPPSKPMHKFSVTLKLGPRPAEPEPFPCCLCISMSKEGLLRVHEPPHSRKDAVEAAGNPKVWMAHEYCAKIVPETWVDEKDTPYGKEKMVFGVDMIVKDRWNLKCSACTKTKPKCHGAPVQCTKGKCPKAFHVNCARDGHSMGIVLGDLREVEKEVVVMESPPAATPYTPTAVDPSMLGAASSSSSYLPGVSPCMLSSSIANIATDGRLYKIIKKYEVQILCTQHNPAVAAQKRASKYDKIRSDLLALPELARIKIRVSAGVFEVTLIRVIEENGTVEVIWDQNSKREFKWGSVVFGSTDGPVLQKPSDIISGQPQYSLLQGYPPAMPAVTAQTPINPYTTLSSATPAPTPQTTAESNAGPPSMVPTLTQPYSSQVQLYPPPAGAYNHNQWPYATQYGTQTYSYPRSEYFPTPAAVSGSTATAPQYKPIAYAQSYAQAQYRGGQLNWQQPYQGPSAQASSSSSTPQPPATSSSNQTNISQPAPGASQPYYRDPSTSTSTSTTGRPIAPKPTPLESAPSNSSTETSTAATPSLPIGTALDHSAAIRELAALSPQETARIAEYLSGMPELRDAVNAAVLRAKQQLA